MELFVTLVHILSSMFILSTLASDMCYRLLVGAPEAQTPQPGVHRGGAVYRCDLSRDDYCQQIPFDRTGKQTKA